jgi:gas vesicle protein
LAAHEKEKEVKMSNDRGASFFDVAFSFLIGTATGFVLGVLFAPAAGTETRKKIGDAAVKTGEKAKEGYEKISKEAERGIKRGIKIVKEKTTEGLDTLKDFVEKKQEEILKKKDEGSKEEEGKK